MLGALIDEASQPLNYSQLETATAQFRRAYNEAQPWRHLVIENLLRTDVAHRAAAAFPALSPFKTSLAGLLEARSYDADIASRDPVYATIFAALHGARFLAWLEAVTSTYGLHPDPYLDGAGLHQGARGSYLRLHADHNTHPRDATRYRRINVLVYLDEVWEAQWNGDLELWDSEARACRKRISPSFDRCVVMEVDDKNFHGYGPLRLPPGRTRKALATYYYADTPARGQSAEPHSTIWPRKHGEHPAARFGHGVRHAMLSRFEKVSGMARQQRARGLDGS